MRGVGGIALCVALACGAPIRGGAAECASGAQASADVARDVVLLPDLLQTDARLGLPRGGSLHCAPVAVANSLLFLAGQGFGRLAPTAPDPALAAADVVKRLASSRCMNTSLAEGTGTAGLLRGLARYLADHGYPATRLDYAGWRAHPREHASGRTRPDLDDVARLLSQPGSGAWLNVGWYVREAEGVRLRRTGGHWVTLAGREGPAESGVWLLRDPSPRAGQRPRVERVRLALLEGGTLVGDAPELPHAAHGVPYVRDGLSLPPGTDVALVDGVVALQLAPACAPSRTSS